jgi:hypothetical protein
MNNSRKNMSRGEIRRRRQLREQRQRIESREDEEHIQEEFSFKLFLKKYTVEVSLVVFLITGVSTVILLGPDKKAVNERQDAVRVLLRDRTYEWDEAYPYGYKIMAFTGKEIIHTSFDTLPKDFRIDWRNASVARIQASSLTNTDEKIKITMRGIRYPPAGVSGLKVTTTFSSRKGVVAKLARIGELELVAEIVEDNGEVLFCLIGLKET